MPEIATLDLSHTYIIEGDQFIEINCTPTFTDLGKVIKSLPFPIKPIFDDDKVTITRKQDTKGTTPNLNFVGQFLTANLKQTLKNLEGIPHFD